MVLVVMIIFGNAMTAPEMAAPGMAASQMAAPWNGCFLVFLPTLSKSKS